MGTAVDQCLLSRTVPLHLRGWALDAQVFGGKAKVAAVGEGDLKQLFPPLQAEFHRPSSRSARAHLGLPALTWASRRRQTFGCGLVIAERARLVDEHDRDAVADRVGQPRILADQLLGFAIVA